jgi:hypothetical protein
MANVQILYKADADGSIHRYFRDEAAAMATKGFLVGITPADSANIIIYRGSTISNETDYPSDERLINTYQANERTLLMSKYHQCINAHHAIETVFLDKLTDESISQIARERGWSKAFIKRDSMSLFALGDDASVWPDKSAQWMVEQYDKMHITGKYAIREYINNIEIFYDEQRYWVLNGVAHHPGGHVPDFVAETASRVYEYSGSHYFTMDVAGDYIVEVNPGESSDRGGDNPLDFFCQIFADAFLGHERS